MNYEEKAPLNKPRTTSVCPTFRDKAPYIEVQDFTQTQDKEMLIHLHEDTNTLITFAGLFAVMMTAFIVESFKWLQPDRSQLTTQLLDRISLQLDNLGSPYLVPALVKTPFEPSASAVAINAFWFSSQVFSVGAAIFGLLAKQAMGRQTAQPCACAQHALHHHSHSYGPMRQEGVQIPVIVRLVPALLEAALLLFLFGMGVLLYTLNAVVFGVYIAVLCLLICLATRQDGPVAFLPLVPMQVPGGMDLLAEKRGAGLPSDMKHAALEESP